jgi:hypothetical protein
VLRSGCSRSSLVAFKHGWTTIKGDSLSVSFADGSQTRCNDYCGASQCQELQSRLGSRWWKPTEDVLGIPWFESIQVTKLGIYNSVLRFYTRVNRKMLFGFGTSHSTFAQRIYIIVRWTVTLKRRNVWSRGLLKKTGYNIGFVNFGSGYSCGDVLKEFLICSILAHVNELPHHIGSERIRLTELLRLHFANFGVSCGGCCISQWVHDNLDNGRIVVSKALIAPMSCW